MSLFDPPGLRYLLLAVPLAISCAKSPVSAAATDAASDGASDAAFDGAAGAVGTDAGLDRYYPRFMSACQVALDDPHNPCAADSALANQNGFSDAFRCASASLRYGSYGSQTMKTMACLYDGRGLVAWEIVSPTPDFCGGHAFAIFADLDPKGQQMGCLTVDSVWYGWDTYGDGGP